MLTSAIDNKNASAIQAAREGVAVSDHTHWGRIRISDDDRIRFLHNQSTNDFQSLKSGQGCDTVMVTSTARTIDLVTAYVLDDAVILANRVFDQMVTPFLVLNGDDGAPAALISLEDLTVRSYLHGLAVLSESEPEHRELVADFQQEYKDAI